MKSLKTNIVIFLTACFMLTGCYTSFNTASSEDEGKAVYVENGWYEIDGTNFYIDSATRQWYSYYGVDLATDKRFLRMAHFRYHHPSSTYFYSPFRNSLFYGYPGYANSFFYRTGLVNPRHGFFAFHPPFYSNPYMHSFYYNRWAHWRYWQSAFPNYQEGSYAYNASATPAKNVNLRSTGLSSGGSEVNSRNRVARVSSRLSADMDDLFVVSSRERINPPAVERVSMDEQQRSLRNRRGDSGYQDRLERNRAARSPLSSWSSWEQSNNNGARVSGGARSTARSSGVVNRTAARGSSGSSAVRGSSSNRGSSSGSATRSSGESSSSRGNN